MDPNKGKETTAMPTMNKRSAVKLYRRYLSGHLGDNLCKKNLVSRTEEQTITAVMPNWVSVSFMTPSFMPGTILSTRSRCR